MRDRTRAAEPIGIEPIDPAHADAQHCLHHYFAELDRRFATGFDPGVSLPALADEMRPPSGVFLVARSGDAPVGCGALKYHPDGTAEIKRMWVSPSVRGAGVGRRLLAELEARAVAAGCTVARLDTNGTLVEAVAMYRAAGYREAPPHNAEPYATLWFEKGL